LSGGRKKGGKKGAVCKGGVALHLLRKDSKKEGDQGRSKKGKRDERGKRIKGSCTDTRRKEETVTLLQKGLTERNKSDGQILREGRKKRRHRSRAKKKDRDRGGGGEKKSKETRTKH